MKRFHVHVSVNDLAKSVYFYSALFNQDPIVQKPAACCAPACCA